MANTPKIYYGEKSNQKFSSMVKHKNSTEQKTWSLLLKFSFYKVIYANNFK